VKAEPHESFQVLWQHDPSRPHRRPLLTDPAAPEAYTFMKAQVEKGFSFSFVVNQVAFDGDVRHLVELHLRDSGVTFPMNESAHVSGGLALSDDERATHIKAINEHRKAVDRNVAYACISSPRSIWPMMKTTTLKTMLRFWKTMMTRSRSWQS
jgi:hypothetical protein